MGLLPNKALQTDKGKLPSLCIRKSHASLPLPLSLVVRRHRNGMGNMRLLGAMVILSSLFGAPGANGQTARFVTEQAFQANLVRQSRLSPRTLAELRKHGVTEDSKLELEFFFYTNTLTKAEALAKALESKGYQAKFDVSASDEMLFIVTGWTTPILMDNETVVSWTKQMTHLGHEHDCEFDGWGTNTNQ